MHSWGYEDLLLLVEAANVPAVSLYKKMGFKEVFRDEEAKASQVNGEKKWSWGLGYRVEGLRSVR